VLTGKTNLFFGGTAPEKLTLLLMTVCRGRKVRQIWLIVYVRLLCFHVLQKWTVRSHPDAVGAGALDRAGEETFHWAKRRNWRARRGAEEDLPEVKRAEQRGAGAFALGQASRRVLSLRVRAPDVRPLSDRSAAGANA
jgi:hypothetical protein